MRHFRINSMLVVCGLGLAASGGAWADVRGGAEISCETVVEWEALINEARDHRFLADQMLDQVIGAATLGQRPGDQRGADPGALGPGDASPGGQEPGGISNVQGHLDAAGQLMDTASGYMSAADVAYCGVPAELGPGLVTCEMLRDWESLLNAARGERFFADLALTGASPNLSAASSHIDEMGNLLDALTVSLGATDVELCGEMEFTPGGATAATDVNRDGRTDIDDLTRIIMDFGACRADRACKSDVNRDGVVNIDDLTLLFISWDQP
jgi:hypothetical protein